MHCSKFGFVRVHLQTYDVPLLIYLLKQWKCTPLTFEGWRSSNCLPVNHHYWCITSRLHEDDLRGTSTPEFLFISIMG